MHPAYAPLHSRCAVYRHARIWPLLPAIPVQEVVDRGAADRAESADGITDWHDGECADIAWYAEYVFEFALIHRMPGGQTGT